MANGGTLTNHGTITGGFLGTAGEGIDLKAATSFVNTGTIEGAAGENAIYYQNYSYTGGAGAYIDAAAAVNSGKIIGGTGGLSTYYAGGTGGIGVTLGPGASLSNTGTLVGGQGGGSDFYNGGTGNTGIVLNGGTLTNSGLIAGGAGGDAGRSSGGNGGTGVILNGGTLMDSGTIEGGERGSGRQGYGLNGAAIQFGSNAGTLELATTAVLRGAVTANAAVDDTLVLQAKGAGSLENLGALVTGFTTIEENAQANWSLGGSITGTGALDMGKHATLTLDGTVSIATLAFAAAGHDTLKLDQGTLLTSALAGFGTGDSIDLAGIQASTLKYADQTLTLFDAAGNLVDTLSFDGAYTQADFALQATKNGTDLLFAGTLPPAGMAHMPDTPQGPDGLLHFAHFGADFVA